MTNINDSDYIKTCYFVLCEQIETYRSYLWKFNNQAFTRPNIMYELIHSEYEHMLEQRKMLRLRMEELGIKYSN